MQFVDLGCAHLLLNPSLNIDSRKLIERDEVFWIDIAASLNAVDGRNVAEAIVCKQSPVNIKYDIGFCLVGGVNVQTYKLPGVGGRHLVVVMPSFS